MLCGWTGHDRVLVDVEGHGREELFADVDTSRTVGWFTTRHPVALAVPPRRTGTPCSSRSRSTCARCPGTASATAC
ncbi:hypothetical protein ACR6C2_42370 [Streptomyces sp. INA 01156]